MGLTVIDSDNPEITMVHNHIVYIAEVLFCQEKYNDLYGNELITQMRRSSCDYEENKASNRESSHWPIFLGDLGCCGIGSTFMLVRDII